MCMMLSVGVTRVVFAGYSNIDRWLKNNQSQNKSEANADSDWSVNTKIISVSINGRKLDNARQKLNPPVEFTLEHNSVCRYLVIVIKIIDLH